MKAIERRQIKRRLPVMGLVLATFLAPRAGLAQFAGEGVDVFASSSSLCVKINGQVYGSLPKAVDPGTLVGRSNVMIEGTAPDVGGIHVPITGCPVCDASVADTDLTCYPAAAPETGVQREVHTEMLDLRLCHACNVCNCPPGPPHACDVICYLAGQSGYDALNAVGQAAKYQNTYGEVESQNAAGNPAADFPATSFFDVKGVITITPAPGGTSGTFVLADPTDSILMVNNALGAFPPAPGDAYSIKAGTKQPGGGGGACSVCNIPLADAVSGTVVGELCCPIQHNAEPPPPYGPGCPTVEVTGDGQSSVNERAPNSNFRFGRAVYLIPRGEMAANRIPFGSQIRAIGWRYAAAGLPATGTLQVYLENTTDSANTKSTTWSTAITGMTLVNNSSASLPTTTSFFDVTFSGGSSFTYTGDALYVAFDWQWPGPTGSGAAVACDTRLASGLKGANGASAAPTTIAASNFRPETRLTPSATLSSDRSVDLVYTYGALPNGIKASHVVGAIATNRGSSVSPSVPLTLSITGAETFSDTQAAPPLAACGGQSLVTFAPFTSSTLGLESVRVEVQDDVATANNTKAKPLAITANAFSYKYPGSTLSGGAGFNAPGQAAARFSTAVATQVDAVTIEFSASSATSYSIAIYGDAGGSPGGLVYTDATPRTVASAGPVTIRTLAPVIVGPGDFYVAVRQTNSTNMVLGYDYESPIRPGAFFESDNLSSGGPWFDFSPASPIKLNVGAIVGSCLVPLSVDVTPNGATPACAAGVGITYTAQTSGGTGNLTYQWTANDIDIPGATSSSLHVSEFSTGTVYYNCRVTDDAGCTNIQDPIAPGGSWGADGAPCDDNNPCTTGTTCSATVCAGGSIVPTPGEAQNLRIAADKATITWNVDPDASFYDLLRGNLSQLPVGPGGLDEACWSTSTGPSAVDFSSPPPPPAGFFYLSRSKNDCANGTYGTQTGGVPRTSTTCP